MVVARPCYSWPSRDMDVAATLDSWATRWAEVHAATLGPIRALASGAPSAGDPAAAAAARLPPGVLDRATLSAALAREEADGHAPAARLVKRLDELEAMLEEMHASVRVSRAAAANQPPDAAAHRHNHGLQLSSCDRTSMLAAPLRAFEAELALKRWTFAALTGPHPPPAAQVESLLVSWQCQPMLLPLDALRAAAASQEQLQGREPEDIAPMQTSSPGSKQPSAVGIS